MSGLWRTPIPSIAAAVALCLAVACSSSAVAAEVEPAASWRLEQPAPPQAPPGASESSLPAGLGTVGDIEFWAPNRGLLITGGDPPTIPAGVWAYDGSGWHELASVCGGVEAPVGEAEEGGRIVWAAPDEFWTVSSGRPGQANQSSEFVEPAPLIDNTLCHFAGGQIVASYAHEEFQADSYRTMSAGACFTPSDCWFAGDPLSEPRVGSFQLHWNGAALEAEPYPEEGRAVQDMRLAEGKLYESVRVSATDRVQSEEARVPPAMRRIQPAGVAPTFLAEAKLPLYGEGEQPEALDGLRLSSGDGSLWAAAGPKPAQTGEAGEVTVARRLKGAWRQLIGPGYPPSGTPANPLGKVLASAAEEKQLLGGEARLAQVAAVAADPGTESAWLALKPPNSSGDTLAAVLVRVSAQGELLEERTLPSAQERAHGVGPLGSADKVACPAENDCWVASARGWLFHLAPEGQRTLPRDSDPSFAGLISSRPADQGLPQLPPDAPPPDTSGLPEEEPDYGGLFEETKPAQTEARVRVPLVSHLSSRLIHGATLQLRFHLAAKARVQLIAKRNGALVARTGRKTMRRGNRTLALRLDPRRWPTKLTLSTHALAPLPTVSSGNQNVGSISTGFVVLAREPAPGLLVSAP